MKRLIRRIRCALLGHKDWVCFLTHSPDPRTAEYNRLPGLGIKVHHCRHCGHTWVQWATIVSDGPKREVRWAS